MSSGFFFREQRAVLVMASLAIWFGLLTQLGPYLPANAVVHSKELAVSLRGQRLTGEWMRRDGRWKFHRVVQVQSLKKPVRVSASGRTMASRALRAPHTGRQEPVTTASINQAKLHSAAREASRKAAREVRAKLAKEIGRWARIGGRWEWQKDAKEAKVGKGAPVVKKYMGIESARWRRRNGVWVFDAEAKKQPFLYI